MREKNYWWEILVVLTAVAGIILGVVGYINSNPEPLLANSIYDTFQMFLLNQQFDGNINIALELSRWLIFATFLLVSFRLFFTIVAPKFLLYASIRWFYRNHIVICGLNDITLELIKRYDNEKIVIISDEDNRYAQGVRRRRIKIVIGTLVNPKILKTAGADRARYVYAVTENDKDNVDIAQSAFQIKQSETNKRRLLKCYTLVRDRELKKLLEDSPLFKYTAKDDEVFFFDGVLFNINELGIKHALCVGIERILPDKGVESNPLLIVGLTDKAENVLFNLAHCFYTDRTALEFIVVENDDAVVDRFKQKYGFIEQFVKIEFVKEPDLNKNKFSSVCICIDNPVEAIKKAVTIRYGIGNEKPNIFIFCTKSERLEKVLNMKGAGSKSLEEMNIYLINSFEHAFKYIVDLNLDIESMAEEAHNMWRSDENDRYDLLTEHFKQSNRNQVIDNYIKSHLLTGKTFRTLLSQSLVVELSDHDRQSLAMMEHRRWMIEKYLNGWRYGDKRDNDFKVHPSLKLWEDGLADEDKEKDAKAVDLMMLIINKNR